MTDDPSPAAPAIEGGIVPLNDLELLATAIAIFILLLLSAFFSGSETALTAASRAAMHQREREGGRRAAIVNRLMARREQLLGTILLGNNLVNIMASALATSLLLRLFGSSGVYLATLAMTLLILIFAEVLPKTYALRHADRAAITVAPILGILFYLLLPFAILVNGIVTVLLRLFGVRQQDGGHRRRDANAEILGTIDLHAREGAMVKADRDMLGSILELEEIEVSEIMTHRSKIEMLDISLPPEKIVEAVLSSPHTRIPFWKDEPENIIGVLHAKNLLRAIHEKNGNIGEIDIAALLTPPWFVPETTTLREQLSAFRERRSHFALVVDEYGALMGLVTLEDILEEIVGDITDEHDIRTPGIRPQSDGSIIVEGSVTIRDLNRQFDWNLPDEEAATIAGLIIHEARIIPEAGQKFSFHGFRFEILRRRRNKISLLRIVPPSAAAG